MDGKTQYVWFDWAMKHMLRNKANFEVLEGLISVMTGKKVRQFNPNTIVPNDMEQWMEYLKTGNIRAEFDAPGLARARETLIFDSMTQGEKKDYRDYVDFVRNQQQNLDTSRKEGREEGIAEGMALGGEECIAIGHEEATLAIARKMRSEVMAPDLIEKTTGIPIDLLS